MEKVIYTLSRKSADSEAAFSRRLRAELGPALLRQSALGLSIAINDADVAAAESLRIVNRDPAIDAVICLWVHSANDCSDIESKLREAATGIAGYLVTESEPLPGPDPATDGTRSPGMMQIAFLTIPEGMDSDEWYSTWRNDHTAVAIETQSTFVYRQNLVVRALTADAPECAAIVEEGFPAEAMESQHAFYDAAGDDEMLQRNRERMWESSKRFVDVARINVVPTSQYCWNQRSAHR